MKSSLTLLCFVLFGLGCSAFAQSNSANAAQDFSGRAQVEPQNPSVKTHPDDYVIGSEDVLAVNIWKEPELSKTVPVRPDGKITLPLIGDIQASGLTPRKLQDNITTGLRSYVSAPEVTVIVQEVKSLKFNIVGEIAKPGSYPLSEPMTVLDAIAVGGGLRDFAKGSRIYVLRTNSDGSRSRLPFDYKQVIKGRKLSENVALFSGDTVVIP